MPKRFTFTLKDGTEITCRQVSPLQLFARGQVPPAFREAMRSLETENEASQEAFLAEGRAGALYDAVIGAGAISPRVWFGADESCPEGQIPVLDLGDDYLALGNAILKGSGMTEETEQALSFPEPEPAHGEPARVNGAAHGALALVASPPAPRRVRFYSEAG